MSSKKFIFLLMIFISGNVCRAQQTILVAAASDLKFAMDSIINVFESTHREKISVTYGSSGKLTEQIANGAPFHIFFSADVSYPEQLEKKKLTASLIYKYATGRIVIWSKTIDTKKGINVLLNPSVKKISIANPDHAPYGKRATEMFDYYHLHESIDQKLVYGENISQTAQFIVAGAADIGVIALSLALSPNLQKEHGNYFIVPEESHRPLIQGAVITKSGASNQTAKTFFEFVKSDQAAAIFKYFGFTKP